MENNKKVMIADDDAGIVDFLSIMLEFEGYIVTSTLNGATLFNIERQKLLPDLILLDTFMPVIDGRDICKYLKQNKTTCKIPIVMLSAMPDVETSAISAGADDFLAKPFEMKALLQKIARHMK